MTQRFQTPHGAFLVPDEDTGPKHWRNTLHGLWIVMRGYEAAVAPLKTYKEARHLNDQITSYYLDEQHVRLDLDPNRNDTPSSQRNDIYEIVRALCYPFPIGRY